MIQYLVEMPYTCPRCHDTFLFQPEVCPTCATGQRRQHQSRRAREKRGSYDPAGRIAQAEFWSLLKWYPCCPCCGQAWDQLTGPISQDHIIPISRGGSNTTANLQPLCQPCNLWKSDHLIAFDPAQPGQAMALPPRLHPHFLALAVCQDPDPDQDCQLELLHPWPAVEARFPDASAAQLEAITITKTQTEIKQNLQPI